MLFYVQYQIPQLDLTANSKLTAIGILNPLHTYRKVHCKHQGVTGYHSQINISFSEYLLCP